LRARGWLRPRDPSAPQAESADMGNGPIAACGTETCRSDGETEATFESRGAGPAAGNRFVTMRWDCSAPDPGADAAETVGWDMLAEYSRDNRTPQRSDECCLRGGDAAETPAFVAPDTTEESAQLGFGTVQPRRPGQGSAAAVAGESPERASASEEGPGDAGAGPMARRASTTDLENDGAFSSNLRMLTMRFGLPSARNEVIDARTSRLPRRAMVPKLVLPGSAAAVEDELARKRQLARTLLESRLPLRIGDLAVAPRKASDFSDSGSEDLAPAVVSPTSSFSSGSLDDGRVRVRRETSPHSQSIEEACTTGSTGLSDKGGRARHGKWRGQRDQYAAGKGRKESSIVMEIRGEREARERVRAFLNMHGFRGVCSKRKGLISFCYPIHVAVNNNDAGMVRALLKAGADAQQKDSAGRTAYQLAMSKDDGLGSHRDILAALSDSAAGRLSASSSAASLGTAAPAAGASGGGGGRTRSSSKMSASASATSSTGSKGKPQRQGSRERSKGSCY